MIRSEKRVCYMCLLRAAEHVESRRKVTSNISSDVHVPVPARDTWKNRRSRDPFYGDRDSVSAVTVLNAIRGGKRLKTRTFARKLEIACEEILPLE